jgi:hypothetical protein
MRHDPIARAESAAPMSPWDIGRARAAADRGLPTDAELKSDWGLSACERALFGLGYLDGKSPFPHGTRETIERAYRSAEWPE